MQVLFYMDMRQADPSEAMGLFCQCCHPPKDTFPFFHELVSGVVHHRKRIDAIINRFSSNWKIGRMGGVDRNTLRIALFELLCRSDIPPKVAINEAIDIGKRFGTDDSGAFINGILDSVRIAMEEGQLAETLEPAPLLPFQLPDRDAAAAASSTDPPAFLPVRGRQGVVKRSQRPAASTKPSAY